MLSHPLTVLCATWHPAVQTVRRDWMVVDSIPIYRRTDRRCASDSGCLRALEQRRQTLHLPVCVLVEMVFSCSRCAAVCADGCDAL